MNSFLNIFFPQKCLICGESISFREHKYPHFCDRCIERLREIPRGEIRCEKCGIPIKPSIVESGYLLKKMNCLCERCRGEKFSFEYNISLYIYGEKLVKRVLHLYKFSNRRGVGYLFAERVGLLIKRRFVGLPVIPVPPRRRKIRKLGWDHVGFIAKILSRDYGIDVFPLLRRARNTKPQKELDLKTRRENVKGAFSIDRGVRDKFFHMKSVILFDDIFTTGATVEECSRILKSEGIERVFVVTIAID